MESVVSRPAAWRPASLRQFDLEAVRTWALAGTVVLYLAIDGGGYDLVVRSQAAIVVWWVVLIGAAWGLLPTARWTRAAWATLAVFGGFVAWTGLAATWSLSSERSLDELSRVACYFGLLLLGISIHRDREQAVRHTVHAVAGAVVLVACLALASRLRPDLFPAAHQTASFLPGTEGRLGWPLNYWNALAALLAIGLPLLLASATSARTLRAQAAAAAAVPVVALCSYLTFSRGGAVAAAAGLLAFLVFSPERVGKLATALVTAAGSAALILAAVHRAAIEQGLTNAAARHQGDTLLVSVLIVCAGVALAQTGVGLAVRHGTPPRWLTFTPGRARALAAGRSGSLSRGGAARRSPGADLSRLAGLQAPGRGSAAPGHDRSLRNRQRQWTVRLLEGGDRRHRMDTCSAGPAPARSSSCGPRVPRTTATSRTRIRCTSRRSRRRASSGSCCWSAFFVLVLGAAIRLSMRSRYEARVRAAGVIGAHDRVLRLGGIRLDLAGTGAAGGLPAAARPPCSRHRVPWDRAAPRRCPSASE